MQAEKTTSADKKCMATRCIYAADCWIRYAVISRLSGYGEVDASLRKLGWHGRANPTSGR